MPPPKLITLAVRLTATSPSAKRRVDPGLIRIPPPVEVLGTRSISARPSVTLSLLICTLEPPRMSKARSPVTTPWASTAARRLRELTRKRVSPVTSRSPAFGPAPAMLSRCRSGRRTIVSCPPATLAAITASRSEQSPGLQAPGRRVVAAAHPEGIRRGRAREHGREKHEGPGERRNPWSGSTPYSPHSACDRTRPRRRLSSNWPDLGAQPLLAKDRRSDPQRLGHLGNVVHAEDLGAVGRREDRGGDRPAEALAPPRSRRSWR